MAKAKRKGSGGARRHVSARAVALSKRSSDVLWTPEELSTVMLLAERWLGMPEQPECGGPVLVHENGSFECHGSDCPGATDVFHGDDAIENCVYRRLRTWSPCSRCAR